MNIPIVQGTEVPVGGNTPYTAAVLSEYQNQNVKHDEQPRAYRDVFFAVAFVAHLVAMISIISINMVNKDEGIGNAYNGIIWMVGVLAVTTIAISSATLGLMMRYAEPLVKISLIFSIAMSGVVAVLGFMSGSVLMGMMGLFMLAVGVCYAKVVWPRIPFAAANLNTALQGVKSNMGLTVVAYIMLCLALGWSMIWFIGLGDAVATSNGGILFLLLVSYYWVHQVLSNTVHVTTAGTIGTWWFVPEEANSCWSPAVQDSFCRATTFSFGSICLGSLIVAVVQSLRAMVNMSRDNDDMKLIVCIIECILALIQDIIEFLNKYAYVYVGLYGFGFLEAGKNVFQLFQQKGWTVVINDDLCDRVLFMIGAAIGCVTGLIGAALAAANPNMLAGLELQDGVGMAGFIIGFIVGLVFSSIVMSTVSSAVATVLVCFAESPAEFEMNHPQLSAEMRSAWVHAWPDIAL